MKVDGNIKDDVEVSQVKNTNSSSSPEIGNHNVSGECGENLEWIYSTASRELTIKGNGNMPEFESRTDVPWMGFVVESVVIEEGVTSIGKNAFTPVHQSGIAGPGTVSNGLCQS